MLFFMSPLTFPLIWSILIRISLGALPPETIISFLVSQGAFSSRNEFVDFFNFDSHAPSLSALNQQRDKLKPEAVEATFHQLNSSLSSLDSPHKYKLLAADGSSFSFFSAPQWDYQVYFVSEGHSAKGIYSLLLNALYNLDTHTYEDAIIQPVHCKDEYKAFCTMVDRVRQPNDTSCIFIADCGYCSYNNMTHVIEKKQFFLFRTKDVTNRGMAAHLPVPKEGAFDICLDIVIKRSQSKKSRHTVIMSPLSALQPLLTFLHMAPGILIHFLSGLSGSRWKMVLMNVL